MSRPTTSRLRRAAARAVLPTLLAAAPAAAQPVLDYSAVTVKAQRWLAGTLVDEDLAIGSPVLPALASVLHELGIARFPTSQSALPLGYVSALMTTSGFGGVGVSFVSGGTPDYASTADWGQAITNEGPTSAVLNANFDIPRMEASILAGPPYGIFPPGTGPFAAAEARLTATRLAADGTQLSQNVVFDYFLTIQRRFQGDDCEAINELEVSDDLRARVPTGIRIIDVGDVCGIETVPFAGTVSLGSLGPGERLLVSYHLSAANVASASRTPELGYQALVGDPFGVSGAGLTVSPATVPEPGAPILLGSGLAAAAALPAARRRRAARPSPSDRSAP